MKLIVIALSWYNFLNQTVPKVALATRRLEVCDTCEHKQQISPTGQMILNAINHQSSTYKCGECACPLAAKAFTTAPCPRWEE